MQLYMPCLKLLASSSTNFFLVIPFLKTSGDYVYQLTEPTKALHCATQRAFVFCTIFEVIMNMDCVLWEVRADAVCTISIECQS